MSVQVPPLHGFGVQSSMSLQPPAPSERTPTPERPTPSERTADGDATTHSQPPADFPFELPPAKQDGVFNKVLRPDGSKVFTAEYEATSTELDTVAQQVQASFEREGLTVERTEYPGTDAKMIRLVAKQAGGREGSATLSTSSSSPNVRVVVGWSEQPTE